MLLHAVGAHYTYAEVPYDAWWLRITGHSLNSSYCAVGGDLGQAYLGTQCDQWDSQKDSALMTVGAVIAIALARRLSTPRGTGILGETGGVGNG